VEASEAVSHRRQGTLDAHAVLQRAQEALGRPGGVGAIESLIFRLTRRIGEALPRYETIRILLPDRFQLVRASTFTVLGNRYWQRPDPTESTRRLAEQNMRRRFAEHCLVFLLRTPGSRTPAASLTRREPGLLALTFTRPPDPDITLLLDERTYRLRAVEDQVRLSQMAQTRIVPRRLTVDAFHDVEGIRFPSRMTQSIAGSVVTIQVSNIRINAGVQAADFEEPGSGQLASGLRR
jgi:hypothetical protein